MNVVKGLNGISAKIICDSISEAGIRMITYELEFHRYILSEYNTHRTFSRNAASTRAIPILKMLQQIVDQPAMPIYYGKNQAGMSAAEELPTTEKEKCQLIIEDMRNYCVSKVKELNDLGLHKQHAGRYLEPWQMVKGVLSSTEWENFFWLRDDAAAQPEIRELARCMREAKDASTPQVLKAGEYHLPYVECMNPTIDNRPQVFHLGDGIPVSLEDAIKVSCARCAAVSYRNEGYTLEKCRELYERLVGSDKKHASALEHCATPMSAEGEYFSHKEDWFGLAVYKPKNYPFVPDSWQEGISHVDRKGQLWSGNIRGYIQHRKLIPGENYSQGN